MKHADRRVRPRAAAAIYRRGAAALVAAWTLAAAAQDGEPVGLADLPDYRAALRPVRPEDPPARPSSFRDLWDHPADYRGRRVEVGGRVERVFHQGPVGEFPPLAEVWVVDPAADPLCLVAPEPAPKPGDAIRFAGTFLRRVRYRGRDADRLAPLIVGPVPPRIEQPAAPGPVAGRSPFEGVVVAVLAGVVVLMLLRAHLRRPATRPIVAEPPPEFQDGPPAGYDELS